MKQNNFFFFFFCLKASKNIQDVEEKWEPRTKDSGMVYGGPEKRSLFLWRY